MRKPGFLAGTDYWFGDINSLGNFAQHRSGGGHGGKYFRGGGGGHGGRVARFVHPLARVGFNPQPEPPGVWRQRFVHPAAKVGFNPQPEPPGIWRQRFVHPGAKVGFNPQPEPPGIWKKYQTL